MVKEEIFRHKHVEDNGDIVEMRIFKVAKSEQNPEGIVYSCVYIREGKRLVAYDNFEGHREFYGTIGTLKTGLSLICLLTNGNLSLISMMI